MKTNSDMRPEINKDQLEGLTKSLLLMLGAGALVIAVVAMPGLGYVLKEINDDRFKKAYKRGTLFSTIKRLEKQKLVGWSKRGNDSLLTLTDKGKKRILQYNLDQLKLKKPDKWDGLFRIVIFDIPENKKIAREMLRKKLKELEFYQLQKSVFVTPFECKDEIDFLRHEFEIAPFVTYILAREISGIDIKFWFKREIVD